MSKNNIDIKQVIANTKQTRQNILNSIAHLTIDQLNNIPTPYRNNVVWNIGHLVVTQQLLCYRMAGVDLHIDHELVDRFRKGSTPEAKITAEEFNALSALLANLMNQLEEDLKQVDFSNYTNYMTSYGVELNAIETAIVFNAQHEAMHYGYLLSMIKHIA